MKHSSYLLVTHGSRDPRPQIALEQLRNLLSNQLSDSSTIKRPATDHSFPLVGTGTLEFGSVTLHEQICQFGEKSRTQGYTHIQIFPLFLLPGIHVKQDIPAEVELAQQAMGETVYFDLRPYLGSNKSGLMRWIASQLQTNSEKVAFASSFRPEIRSKINIHCPPQPLHWILLSHGSRYSGGNAPIEEIANTLGISVAYWLVSPSLEAQITHLVRDGHQRLGILPYFLFAGSIMDVLNQTIQDLKQQFPTVEFYLTNPLGATVELVDLIKDLMAT